MKKIYLPLTQDQLTRDVIFSSTLSTEQTEQEGDRTHEVYKTDTNTSVTIDRLYDDSFFKNSPWKYNIIRK